MDDIPDMSLNNSPNINSVLKPPKPRVPLKDLVATPLDDDNTAARKRRVSFANVNKIKEFSAGAESMVVCHTPAYEEPFYLSSDSSYPSGVDGWTPAKGQHSTNFKPLVFPEKENIITESITHKSTRMSSGMDLTNVVGPSIQNTRYSVSGMNLTEMVIPQQTRTDQRTRFSMGMDLTNVVGHSAQNTRYSVSGMDLTETVIAQQTLIDQRTRLSMGMDLTNVVGHSAQNTRYSVSGMDLTEMANPQQILTDQRTRYSSIGMDLTRVIPSMQSTRYSVDGIDSSELSSLQPTLMNQSTRCSMGGGITDAVGNISQSPTSSAIGMDVTEVADQTLLDQRAPRFSVGRDMKSMRYSCNEMDLTEAANPNMQFPDQRQSLYGRSFADNVLLDDSDALELTEAVYNPRFSVGSTKYMNNDMDLTGNVLYSVNNARYSVNGTDMTRAAVSRHSNARRKSSRYSLVNMDLTDVITDDCDGLEFTEIDRDPKIKASIISNPLDEMDLIEGRVNEGLTRFSENSMDCTGIVGDKFEYSADAEHSMDFTNSVCNPHASTSEKENILPSSNMEFTNLQNTSKGENLILGNPKLRDSANTRVNMSIMTSESVPGATLENLLNNGSVNNVVGPKTALNTSDVEHEVHRKPLLASKRESKNILGPEIASEELKEVIVESKKDLSKTDESSDCHKRGNDVKNTTYSSQQNNKSCSMERIEEMNVNISEKERSCINIELMNVRQSLKNELLEIGYRGQISLLNSSNCENLNKTNLNTTMGSPDSHCGNPVKLTNLNDSAYKVTEECEADIEKDTSLKELLPATVEIEHSIMQTETTNDQLTNEVDMDIVVVDNSDINENKAFINNVSHSVEVNRITQTCPQVVLSLDSSMMNLSVKNCTLVEEMEEEEKATEKNEQSWGKNDAEATDVILCKSKYEEKNQVTPSVNLSQGECNQLGEEDITAKQNSSTVLSMSADTSLNVSSGNSLLYNKNITITRGRSKSYDITSHISLHLSEYEVSSDKEQTITSESSSVIENIEVNNRKDAVTFPQNQTSHEKSSLQPDCSTSEKGSKRSFEVALEPENDTEESPIKQLCLLKADSTECEILSNITAPSFLMNTFSAPNETFPSLEQSEASKGLDQSNVRSYLEPSMSVESPTKEKNPAPLETSLNVQENNFSLRFDDINNSLTGTTSNSSSHHEEIDLCDSNVNTSTNIKSKKLLNSDCFKEKTIKDTNEISRKQNEMVYKTSENLNMSELKDICVEKIHFNPVSWPVNISEVPALEKKSTKKTGVQKLEKTSSMEIPDMMQSNLKSPTGMKSILTSKMIWSKPGKIRSLGEGVYTGDFIPNWIEIQFSTDSLGNVVNPVYKRVCSGSEKTLGEYLLHQVKSVVLPGKASDLILQLQNASETYLTRLARNLDKIQKYHNGKIKGNILALEVTSCRRQFWAFININIKYPQYLNTTDISIAEQRIGELKLSQVRQLFSSIEKDQNQLLNFAAEITKLQY